MGTTVGMGVGAGVEVAAGVEVGMGVEVGRCGVEGMVTVAEFDHSPQPIELHACTCTWYLLPFVSPVSVLFVAVALPALVHTAAVVRLYCTL